MNSINDLLPNMFDPLNNNDNSRIRTEYMKSGSSGSLGTKPKSSSKVKLECRASFHYLLQFIVTFFNVIMRYYKIICFYAVRSAWTWSARTEID